MAARGWASWVGLVAFAFPAATQASEAVVERTIEWKSPLGLTVIRREAAIDGAPLLGQRDVELRDGTGRSVFRRDGLAPVRDALAAGPLPRAHPAPGVLEAGRSPLRRWRRAPAWIVESGVIRAVLLEHRLDLHVRGRPVAEEVVRDALTGDVRSRRALILEAAPQGLFVYAAADGRPAHSPFGDTWPHPTGVPDGSVPGTAIAQAMLRQDEVAAALGEAWLADAATETGGNNVVAYFNSIVNDNGIVLPEFDEAAWQAPFDAGQGDFLARANDGIDFAYPYDPFATQGEYFQVPGQSPPLPDPGDPALNAKIVQAFLAANWLHDFFYRAGFDEVAGNNQADNFGRGGLDGDPLTVLAGYPNTFAVLIPDGDPAFVALGRNTTSASRRDASMDFTVAAHEWGHILIDRVAGGAGRMQGLQAFAMHEGIADFIGLLTGVDGDDDLSGAFAIGQYMNLDYQRPSGVPPAGVAPDAMYYGIRRYPYSTSTSRNPLTLSNLVEAPSLPYFDWKGRGPDLDEVHTAGEVIAQALFQCFAAMASRSDAPGFEEMRLRAAQYLVAALMLFSERPTFLEARNHLLTVMGAVDADDRAACRSGFAARGFGAGAIGPPASSQTGFTRAQDGFLDQDQKLVILAATAQTGTACADCAPGVEAAVVSVQVLNAGLVAARDLVLDLVATPAGAVTFPEGSSASRGRLAPQATWTVEIPVRADVAALPGRAFEFEAHAAIAGADAGTDDVGQGSATFAAPGPGPGGGGGGKGGGGADGASWLAWLALLACVSRAVRRPRATRRSGSAPASARSAP